MENSSNTMRSLMLYIHIPFCPSKCHFCGWVQGISKRELFLSPNDDIRKKYVSALCHEIRSRSVEMAEYGYLPNIIYWGGGTATSLTELEIETIHTAISQSYDLSAVSEATIEGSPDTVSPGKLALIRSLGYQRVSFGIQSFNNVRLRRIGRTHCADDAINAVQWAVANDFKEINIDLMCGFPDESLNEVEENLLQGTRLPVTHISFYPYRPIQDTVMLRQLTRGGETVNFKHQKLAYSLGRTLIEEAGFPEYAMSYFGTPSLNDLAIFRVQQDWVGFGAGAHSLFRLHSRIHFGGRLEEYIRNPLVWDLTIPAHSNSVVLKLLGQGLSTFRGIDRMAWLERTGRNLEETLCDPELRSYVEWFRCKAGLTEDSIGIRLEKEKMADAFIDMFSGIGH